MVHLKCTNTHTQIERKQDHRVSGEADYVEALAHDEREGQAKLQRTVRLKL